MPTLPENHSPTCLTRSCAGDGRFGPRDERDAESSDPQGFLVGITHNWGYRGLFRLEMGFLGVRGEI